MSSLRGESFALVLLDFRLTEYYRESRRSKKSLSYTTIPDLTLCYFVRALSWSVMQSLP